ncbi:SDR family NAD(P)-dependent oxidoreductase [Leptospira idonii]|uniref:SDR family oxidoreductase n=1 Tax=Leptospira idonii TaxID=1193500 RepID=A0A4R9M367_9LEPT|nr:SDR family NAD(P)-dependent oxidoreductase [Leptospira idonii]TGN20335.1 SDR family oxidoreductase [Leptospira idonii]
MNLFDVKGKTVLITGASRGIGKTLALGFRDAGAIVYGAGSRPESVEWMAKEGINGVVIDVRSEKDAYNEIGKIREKHGKLNCLINNAGIATNTPASGFKEDELQNIIQTNYAGVFRNCQAYYKHHKKDGGNIINVASVLGIVGSKLASVYSGTKGAVITLSKALAIEWCNSGYRVNVICPGLIDTDMTEMIKSKDYILSQVVSAIPMGRLGKPEEILGAAIYLASDASSYVTGQEIIVDGGMIAQ